MGVESMLVDRKHRRLFYLGKWYGDIPLKRCGWEAFLTAVMEPFTNEFPEDDETLVWRRKQARRMWAFCCVAEWDVTRTRDGQADHPRNDFTEAFEIVSRSFPERGVYEVSFDGHAPSDVHNPEARYRLVMSVYNTDDSGDRFGFHVLHPDPCAEAQAEAERG